MFKTIKKNLFQNIAILITVYIPCFDTKKVERFFKERRIKYQLIDMKEKGISKGENRTIKPFIRGA